MFAHVKCWFYIPTRATQRLTFTFLASTITRLLTFCFSLSSKVLPFVGLFSGPPLVSEPTDST